MNRRAGFTLIEVTAALTVMVVLALLTVTLGRDAVQRLREDRFVESFRHEWQVLATTARQQHALGTMDIQSLGPERRRVTYTVYGTAYRRELTFPPGMTMKGLADPPATATKKTLSIVPDQFFTTPRTLILVRRNQKEIILTFQLGWGVMLRQ